jgi:hypothetical protein
MMLGGRKRAKRLRPFIAPITLSLSILILWTFPKIWYNYAEAAEHLWLEEKSVIAGWEFESFPIGETAEKLLVADKIVSGEFRAPDGEMVRVFSARRQVDDSHEIGMFVHTPDRCWVEGGWKLLPLHDQLQKVILNGIEIQLERRLFELDSARELVYFFGLVGGQQLPYRLDHNLSIASKNSSSKKSIAAILQLSDQHFYLRLWQSFTSRSKLSGPKQFVRISTPVTGRTLEECDMALKNFLSLWLTRGDSEASNAEAIDKNL